MSSASYQATPLQVADAAEGVGGDDVDIGDAAAAVQGRGPVLAVDDPIQRDVAARHSELGVPAGTAHPQVPAARTRPSDIRAEQGVDAGALGNLVELDRLAVLDRNRRGAGRVRRNRRGRGEVAVESRAGTRSSRQGSAQGRRWRRPRHPRRARTPPPSGHPQRPLYAWRPLNQSDPEYVTRTIPKATTSSSAAGRPAQARWLRAWR